MPNFDHSDDFGLLLYWLQTLVNSDQTGFDTACTLHAPIHEHLLYRLVEQQGANTPITITSMVAMLGLLYLRFGLPDRWQQPEWAIARMGQDGRLSFDGFIQSLYQRLEDHAPTIHDIVKRLYDVSIIRQHQLVADSKQPDNTYRFQRERNRLIFYRLDNSLGFMSSRFDALSTTLHELGLCGDLTEPMHKLTPNGIKLLTEGDIK